MLIFLFKQKTAYDMRISDWSSDVCSSDLKAEGGALRNYAVECEFAARDFHRPIDHFATAGFDRADGPVDVVDADVIAPARNRHFRHLGHHRADADAILLDEAVRTQIAHLHRSEEHTSELQSLMRISYAVFCLKKKKIQVNKTIHTQL